MRFSLSARHALLAGAAATTMGLAACGGTSVPSGPVATNQVAIQSFAFDPATVMVKPGATVTWTQQDEEPHTVLADDGSFTSLLLTTGQKTYTHTFSTSGTYHYHCGRHPYMHGTVTVTAG